MRKFFGVILLALGRDAAEIVALFESQLAKRIAEAQRIAAEMEDLIRALQRQWILAPYVIEHSHN